MADGGAPEKVSRILYLDGARGYLLLMMFLAHYNSIYSVPVYIFHHAHFSAVMDAEFFVMISGFVCALSFYGAFARSGFMTCLKAVLNRLRTIYIYQILAAFSVTLLCRHAFPLILLGNMHVNMTDSYYKIILNIITFVWQPKFVDILILYLSLMIFIPLGFKLLEERRVRLYIAVIVGSWILAMAGTDLRFEFWVGKNISPLDDYINIRGYFNAFSYAFLFYIAFYFGWKYVYNGHSQFIANTIPLKSKYFYISLITVIFFAISEIGKKYLGTPEWLYAPTRTDITIQALINMSAISYAIYYLLCNNDIPKFLILARAALDRVLRFQPLVVVGQDALFVYSLHAVLIYFLSYILIVNDWTLNRLARMTLLLAGMLTLIGAAYLKKQLFPRLP